MTVLIATDKQRIARAFNRAAATYDQQANLQQAVGEILLQQVKEQGIQYDHITDLGCGTGLVTDLFARQLEYQQFNAVDISDQSIAKAKIRLANHSINFEQTDIKNFKIHDNQSQDLILANMSLHWCDDIPLVLNAVKQQLNESGLLAFTIPLSPSLNELNPNSKNWFHTKEDISQTCHSLNFKSSMISTEKIILNFDSATKALRYLQKTGVNVVKSSNKTLHGRDYLSKIFQETSDLSQPVTLTFYIGFFLFRKIKVDET